LRALGFTRADIVLSFLLESVLLALAGGLIGATAALGLGAVHFSIINFSTWSEVVFSFEPTLGILVWALVWAGGMGVAGGLLPALRASRMSPVTAMRG
jgi:putative ABC transport system permease protein